MFSYHDDNKDGLLEQSGVFNILRQFSTPDTPDEALQTVVEGFWTQAASLSGLVTTTGSDGNSKEGSVSSIDSSVFCYIAARTDIVRRYVRFCLIPPPAVEHEAGGVEMARTMLSGIVQRHWEFNRNTLKQFSVQTSPITQKALAAQMTEIEVRRNGYS